MTLQDFIKIECHRWKHERRWQNQAQAISVANSKWSKYVLTGKLPEKYNLYLKGRK